MTGEHLPWMEKYRPQRLANLVYQDSVREMLTAYIRKPHLPHLLLYGPPGTGKTTSILAFANEVFGPDHRHERVYELNASHERDIHTIREKVKAFANIFVTSHPTEAYPCPSYKIIVLDEADAMTAEAQRALRRIMETTTQQTRFCLICNYASKIIDPIVSRCTPMRFKPIPPSVMAARLQAICTREQLQLNRAALRTLLTFSMGDFRIALNTLQRLHTLLRYDTPSKTLVQRDPVAFFRYVFGFAPPHHVRLLADTCFKSERSDIATRRQSVDTILAQGYDVTVLLRQLQSHLAQYALSKHALSAALHDLAECEYRCIHGADVRLQLLYLATRTQNATKVLQEK